MMDCLPATGSEPPVALWIALALVAAGVAALLWSTRLRHRGSGAALGALLVLVVGAGVLGAGAPSATAAGGCPPSPTSAPTTGAPIPTPAILPDVDTTFASGGVTYAASYRGPSDTTRPVAAAVILVGTGAVDRNGTAPGLVTDTYSFIADILSANGIATIRYDKLGTGATGLGPYTTDPAAMLPLGYDRLRIQPGRDALSFLAAQPGIDATRLIVIGHSEGGGVAISIADDPGDAPAPAGLALVEPLYGPILDVISRQFTEQMDAAVAAGAMTAADAATLHSWGAAGAAEIRDGTAPFPDPGPVPLPDAIGITQVFQTDIASNIYGSDPAEMVISHAYRTLYGQQFDAVIPADIAPEIRIPTFVSCGTKDFNTPCGDGTTGSGVIALSQRFAPGVARFVQIPNMVHILRDVGDDIVPNVGDQIAYPFSEDLKTELGAFVAGFASPAAS